MSLATDAVPDARYPEASPEPASPTSSRRAELASASACVLFGLAMALLPHALWWARTGSTVYLADHDSLLYESVIGQAYDNHPTRIADPMHPGPGDTMYPWSQFVPAILLSRALGWGPTGVDLIWRAFAGLSLGLSTYFLLRQFVRRPLPATALALVVLADAGVMSGHLLLRQATVAARLAAGRADALFATYPQIHSLWRVITPGLSLWALLLHVGLVARARARPTSGRILLAGLGFGLLFHVYFYFWTAAGLALVLALVGDAGHRKVYFHAGWIGGLVGLPAIVAGSRLKRAGSTDWLPRTDNFLPIDRLSELMVPRLAVLLIVVTLAWLLWARRRELLHLWCLALAGLLLLNHQVISGLQIQNFHWSFVWAPCVSLLLVLLAAGSVPDPRTWPRPLATAALAAVALQTGVGLWLRTVEASRTRETVELMADYARYRAQRLAPGAPALEPNAVLAGDPSFVDLAAVLENQRPLDHYAAQFSNAIPDTEWDERIALNAYLGGRPRAEFRAELEESGGAGWGPWARDPGLRARQIARRLDLFDRAAAGPAAALDRFGVRYLALPAGQSPPDPGWSRLQDGPTWTIWARGPRR